MNYYKLDIPYTLEECGIASIKLKAKNEDDAIDKIINFNFDYSDIVFKKKSKDNASFSIKNIKIENISQLDIIDDTKLKEDF